MKKIKHFDAFSGIGGFTKGLMDAFGEQYENVGYSEKDKHAIANYRYNFPEHKNYGDITTIRPEELPDFDIFSGGFPCQTFSLAGKRQGFEDARGTMFFEIIRICEKKKPRILLLENVKGLLNHDSGRTFATVYRLLNHIGYTVEFQLCNTSWILPQNRERIYIVGHLAEQGRSFSGVFPFTESDFVYNKRVPDSQKVYENSLTITAKGVGNNTGSFIKVLTRPHGFNKGAEVDISPCIKSNNFEHNNHLKIASATKQGYEIANHGDSVNFSVPNSLTRRGRVGKEIAQTIDTQCNQGVVDFESEDIIRRYTEIECEKLQGFSPDWTKYGNYDGTIKQIPKTQRYKMCGNAVTKDLPELIGRKLLKILNQ